MAGCSKNKEIDQTQKLDSSQAGDDTRLQDAYILKIGEETVYYNEAMVYVLLLKQEYEPSLGAEIWDYNTKEGSDFEDMAKQEVIDQITELKIIASKAKELGIELDGDEKGGALTAAKDHFNLITPKDKKTYGITLGTLEQIYRDNQLATKVYDITTSDVDTEVSDKEAKQVTIWQILLKTSSKDKEGNESLMEEEEKKVVLKKARNLLKKARETEDFQAFAKENTEDIKVEYTFGKGDMNKVIEDTSFGLKTNQLSGIVESEHGYHILYCVSDFNEDATADKKEDIIMDRQTKAFEEIYKEWLKGYSVTINKLVWEQIAF